jgi:hypothetical protein
MALHFFVVNMNFIPSMVVTLFSSQNGFANFTQSILTMLSTSLIMLIMSILLWIFADRISIAIVNAEPESIEIHKVDYNKIAMIAFTIIGLLVLTNAIPVAIRMVIQHSLLLKSQLNYKETSMYADSIARIIGEIVRICIGIWLLIGSKGIIKIIKAFKDLGMDRIEDVKE